MADQPRPRFRSRMSSYFLPRAAGNGDGLASNSASPGELTALLLSPPTPLPTILVSSSDQSDSRPPSTLTLDISTNRPNIARAATSLAVVHTNPPKDSIPARPTLKRSASTTVAFVQTRSSATHLLDAMDRGNPGLLRRATQAISQQLELGEGSSYAHRNAPCAPSNWTDHTHRRYLVKLWDGISEVTANSSKYPKSTTAMLVGTQQTMVHRFPELGEGDVTLTRDWIEYVLGIALRHPFCTQDKMGRWEVLASSGGARATWGPW